MQRSCVLIAVLVLALPTAVFAQSVTLSFGAVKDGQTVGQNMPIHWTITAGVSTGDNEGLAAIAIDLEQDAGNPVSFDIPPANGVPAELVNFSRPAGITNPPEGTDTTGYVGVQRGTTGQKNLKQIGGAQNTFGEAMTPGTGMAENAMVVGGVGQGGSPQVLAAGTFTAPAVAGTYTFRLNGAVANVLTAINTPPAFSPVQSATVGYSPQTISFTVGDYGIGDMNCDGAINGFDIDPYVLALGNQTDYETTYPNCDYYLADINGDGAVNGFDIDPFVTLIGGG